MVRSAEIWNRLESRWDFTEEREEAASLNERFRLVDPFRFDPALRPVFFVGDLDGEAEYLAIGLKPGRNVDSNPRFVAEKRAISGDFKTYVESRTHYFVSDSFNGRHYWPLANHIANFEGETRSIDVGPFLQSRVIQAELLPFFAPRSGLSDAEFLDARRTTNAGQLADQTLTALLALRPWKAIFTRYSMTGRIFRELYCGGAMVFESADGRAIPVIEINGRTGTVSSRMGSSPRRRRVPSALDVLDDSALGLRNSHGRRWAVTQAFASGGTVDEILARADYLNRARCTELGHEPERDVWGDRVHLRDEASYYPTRFRELGWSVRHVDDRWLLEYPLSA